MTPEQATALRDNAAELGFHLDEPAGQRIATFLAILNTWNPRMRLTGERDARTLAEKHVVDSLAVATLLPASGTIVDVGTGAGFPGVVLSCVRPDLEAMLAPLEAAAAPNAEALSQRFEGLGEMANAGESDTLTCEAVGRITGARRD